MTHEERKQQIREADESMKASAEWFLNQINEGYYTEKNGNHARELLFSLLETAKSVGAMESMCKTLENL